MSRKIDLDTLRVEAWDVERPIDAENNNKIHTSESVARLAKSMAALGQIQPLIVDRNGVIIAGHGRRMAARLLGWESIKVIRLPVDEKTARKMRLADNLAVNENKDADAIARELRDLFENGVDLEGLGEEIGLGLQQISMLTPDLAGVFEMDTSVLSEDVAGDVDRFSREGDEKAAEIEEGASVTFKEVFGVTKLRPGDARSIRMLLAEVCAETGIEDPAEALAAWAEEMFGQ